MSEIKVNSIKGVGASAAAITVNNSDGTCTANITNNLSNKRLTINGDMKIAQRGTSSTSDGYATVDRFRANIGGNDENPTQSQGTVASNVTPYTLGFRKSFKFTNGNQTSGAGSSDRVTILHRIEAQDIANSGWNYTSSSSFITLSFWVKSSVAQNFFGFLRTIDGTSQLYPFETGSLTADTWTKITKTIPGNSNLQFDDDNDLGLDIEWDIFRGTDTTGSITLNAWGAYNSSVRTPDQTSTWYTTNDATFEITGVQLEVSDHATDFEHRSFGEELAMCKRYFELLTNDVAGTKLSRKFFGPGYFETSSVGVAFISFAQKREAPTVTANATGNFIMLHTGSSVALTGLSFTQISPTDARADADCSSAPYNNGDSCFLTSFSNSVLSTISLDSEL